MLPHPDQKLPGARSARIVDCLKVETIYAMLQQPALLLHSHCRKVRGRDGRLENNVRLKRSLIVGCGSSAIAAAKRSEPYPASDRRT